MNVIINPSGTAGFSFKGLHNYCAHDKEGSTSERVEWMSARNLAASPKHAYKIMIATADAQNQLKRSAGVRVGRHAENGEVMHIVMSFDQDEPHDRETMETAADQLLSRLGKDPTKRGGKGATVRQMADEHQAVLYAHTDTKNPHVHIMLNVVHPKHGRRLPTSNDQLKASRWALGFSKEHGTAHKTPAREENMAARDRGEYVKAKRRKSRKAYEEEKALEQVSNDNDRVKTFLANQKRKDAALYEQGRTLAAKQQQRSADIEKRFEDRKAQAEEAMKKRINQAKATIREEFRPQFRDLKTQQAAERKTFEALEASFFGRTKNALKTVRAAFDKQDTGLISRSFRILSNAGERKTYFERGQERETAALENKRSEKIDEAIAEAKIERKATIASTGKQFTQECDAEKLQAAEEARSHKADWKQRGIERTREFSEFAQLERTKPSVGGDFTRAQMTDEYFKDLERRVDLSDEFDETSQSPAEEQDNERDDGQDRS